MSLALDGEELKIDNLKVAMSLELKDQDMSGQSSATDTSEQGDKGKKLDLSGTIPFVDIDTLTRLYMLSSAKDEAENRKIYRIGHDIARALKVRNVKFMGRVHAREHESLQAWSVSFSLREQYSVAEKREQRAKEQKPTPKQEKNTRHQEALKKAEEAMK